MNWLFGSSKASSSDDAVTAAPTSASSGDACPVDHSTRSRWLQQQQQQGGQSAAPHPFAAPSARPPAAAVPASSPSLSLERETSSIPRYTADASTSASTAGESASSGKWVYPSPSQFYTALQRKNRNPRQEDMDIVVPIHNAVNERTWNEVMKWENEALGPAAAKDAVQLVNFKGRPNDRTPRAWWKILLG